MTDQWEISNDQKRAIAMATARGHRAIFRCGIFNGAATYKCATCGRQMNILAGNIEGEAIGEDCVGARTEPA